MPDVRDNITRIIKDRAYTQSVIAPPCSIRVVLQKPFSGGSARWQFPNVWDYFGPWF